MIESGSLQTWREHIDTLDQQIQALISERARCAQQIGVIKQAAGATGNLHRPEREAQVLRRVMETNRGPLSNEEMARLFREIMSACLALEDPLRIAFFGPEGTFTQAAALKHFGQSIHGIPLRAIDEVFREVEAGTADYGVVPVENSTEGVVNHTLDMFLQSPLRVCGEVQMRINHHLISCENHLSGVHRIYSHRQSLAQCREWLDAKMPNVERVEVSSNGEAALRVRDGAAGTAAIAGQCAADIYGLPILVRNIEDEPNNTTRFLIIGTQPIPPSGDDRTALLVSSLDRPGSLFRLLEPLARHEISMTRIESRPSRRGMWDYVFFIDLDGHVEDASIASAIADLRQQASLFRVLGSYPKGVL
ncbi:MAG: prephenate dehydratase [Candidatus Contendobacter odensis]|uniref:Bifunctional chorismate mutase/prephenate dehydratase n=1 Tax=Candidatus Contendibacter odensensis TaxID=1400860 RepID=A0A2G6PGC4_9GAMM|nr:MAG: prephenate dehydratase [Candidatus Contendobacter odensis]